MAAIARTLGLSLIFIIVIISGGWGALALFFAGPNINLWRYLLTAAFAICSVGVLAALFFRRWRWYAVIFHILLFVSVLVWWSNIEPSNSREWQTDVATLASATVEGYVVTVHNIRNFDYRSEFDYTPHYYDKSFDLRELTGIDVVSVYWMGPAIAHVFLSFEFKHSEHLAISIETRKEKGEEYSTIKGFFRRYELYYVVADERDVIRLRTNYRHDPIEDVYVYRAHGDAGNGRRLFLEYIHQINTLNIQPEFYNTLTTNCTTSIWLNARVNSQHLPMNWKILVSGYLPEYLYQKNRLQTNGLSFEDLRRSVHVNARALLAGDADDFSQRIRMKGIAHE